MSRFVGKLLGVSIPLLIWVTPFYGQVTLVKDGKPNSRIVVASGDQNDRRAAWLLQDFVGRISGVKIPVVDDISAAKFRRNDFVIGCDKARLTAGEAKQVAGLKVNGFLISSHDGVVKLVGGGGKGSVYGVVTLLENILGVDYWGEHEVSYNRSRTVSIPDTTILDNPVFRFRQTGCYAARTDTLYKLWHRLDEPEEVFAAGLWVHTFDKLLPSDVYGKDHPEYYAYFKGKRHPGKASQWCLTNPDVFEIVAKRIDSIFKANPDKHIISVSQNDGNYTNCTCDSCRAIDTREGAFSGSLIWFLNKLAARFPDKEFSTLAYLYTMNPPAHIKPLPNVNIMLCDIDCEREVSLTENRSGREFVKAMKGWANITSNIFVWDYGINFDGYLSPFPNFHILQDNIKLFREHHATMHHSQIAGSKGGDFAELRAYLVAKLMWNPNVNVDSLMHHFLDGYYGEAGRYIYQYIKIMEGASIGSGQRLWIYDSPVSHKAGMLKPELMRRYNLLFDKAEEAVATNEVLLKRVRRTRLPLQFSELEIARTESDKDTAKISGELALFEKRVKELEVPTLNERNNSPLEYCDLYRLRYMPRKEHSLAEGAKVIYGVEPTGRYKKVGETALTDGLFGGSTFVESWVGWEGVDASFTVDLGSIKEFKTVETDFLHQLGQWILLPRKVVYSYSDDGVSFKHWETHELPEDRSVEVKFKGVRSTSAAPVRARYIKVDVTATKECPSWHYGVGHPSWFFVDEVSVF